MILKELAVEANTSLGTATTDSILPSIGWTESFSASVSVNSGLKGNAYFINQELLFTLYLTTSTKSTLFACTKRTISFFILASHLN